MDIMKYNITQDDKNILLQSSLQYKYRLLVINKDGAIIDELSSLQVVGSYSIDADSDIRRTTSFTMYLDSSYKDYSVEQKLYEWIGCSFELQIGMYSIRNDAYHWYKCGYYFITSANTSYNSVENSISTNLSDWFSKLNGTRNGQLGGKPTILIENKNENDVPVTIKQATEDLLQKGTDIENYLIDDIGEFAGIPQNNADYLEYRASNPEWNQLPYDLKYEAGCMMGDILSEIKELYPNCQMYFDIYGNFCFNQIPSCEHDMVTLDNTFLQDILLADASEGVSYDIESIKNVTEVFGPTYEITRYAQSCVTSGNTYVLSIEKYTDYSSGDIIAFVPDTASADNMQLQVTGLAVLPVYHENKTEYVQANTLQAGETYVLQIKKVKEAYVAYYLGQFQPHALCVLTDSEKDATYTKAYFAEKYDCKESNITLRVEPNSPFTIQRLGEILDVKHGDTFDNILSDSVALENAIYYNRKSSSMNETVTIHTKMIPFLDVNEKVEYKKQQDNSTNYYIIKSISNDTDSNTSSIVMCKFYPLYYI